jgi:predicted dehydrogenase
MDLYGGPVAWLCGTAEQRTRPWAVEDYAAAFLKFDSGVTGTIRGSELTTYSDHSFELRGSTGLIRMLGERVHLQQSQQGMYEPDSGFQWSDLEAAEVERPAPASTYVDALVELVAALDGEGTLRSDGRTGRRSMEMVTAVYQSQLTGSRPVSFPLSRLDNGVEALRQAGTFRERG